MRELGFDYIECCASAVYAMSAEEFSRAENIIKACELPCEAANGLFPASLTLLGEAADEKRTEEYIRRTYDRLSRIGVKVAVFGSGQSRRVPDGFDRSRAYEQLIKLCRALGDESENYGIVTALEPLNARETNLVTSQKEGLRAVMDAAHPSFRLICDYYHLRAAGEGREELCACGELLTHTHISNPQTRRCPEKGDGEDYEAFFGGLYDIGYSSRVSIECAGGRDRYANGLELLKAAL